MTYHGAMIAYMYGTTLWGTPAGRVLSQSLEHLQWLAQAWHMADDRNDVADSIWKQSKMKDIDMV